MSSVILFVFCHSERSEESVTDPSLSLRMTGRGAQDDREVAQDDREAALLGRDQSLYWADGGVSERSITLCSCSANHIGIGWWKRK